VLSNEHSVKSRSIKEGKCTASLRPENPIPYREKPQIACKKKHYFFVMPLIAPATICYEPILPAHQATAKNQPAWVRPSTRSGVALRHSKRGAADSSRPRDSTSFRYAGGMMHALAPGLG
jgi:hypothetical protein